MRSRLLTAVLILGVSGVESAAARTHVAAAIDSGRGVRRVTVSDRGIVVDRGGSRDTSFEWSGDASGLDRDQIRGEIKDRIRRRIRDHIRVHGGMVDVGDNGAGIVRIWSDAVVPAGTSLDGDAVAVFGSVRVEGEVSGDVVAVFGTVHLEPGAKVGGDVVSIGGVIEQPQGVTINGESVQIGFSPFTWGLPGVSIMLFAIAAGWLVSMFVGWIFALLFPTGMLRVASVVERRPAASFFMGVLSLPLFLVALVLLCVTLIGIPLAILLPMLYAIAGYAGQLAATSLLGARLTRRPLSDGLITPLFVGTLFVAILLAVGAGLMAGTGAARPASLFLSLSGVLLLLGLGALGTGAILLSRFGTRPKDVVLQRHAAAVPHPAVAPPAV